MWFIVLVIAIIIIVKVNKNKKEQQEQQRLELEAQQKIRLEEQRQREREEEEERKERARKRQQEQAHINAIRSLFKELDEFQLDVTEFVPKDKFGKLLELKHTSTYNLAPSWNKEHQSFLESIYYQVQYIISKMIQDSNPEYNIDIHTTVLANYLKKIKYIEETTAFDDTIQKLNAFWDINFKHPLHIKYKEYGNCEFDFSMDDLDEDAIKLKLEDIESHKASLKDLYEHKYALPYSDFNSILNYTNITEYLNIDDVYNACLTMWYYALKKPFIVDLFERACNTFRYYSSNEGCECMEVMLAKICNWKSLGGSSLVMGHQEEIQDWLKKIVSINEDNKSSEDGSLKFIEFASTLAWMELYDLELLVLKKLVELKVQLWSEAQERLSFLSSGGTINMKIYEPKNEIFSFDTSSADWKENEYNIFFRKLAMKKIQLNYSLVVKSWTKTYPLQNGQKYCAEDLYHEFELIVDDFDGEVTLNKEDATALNLTNLSYQDAMIFRFTSERNRCITMLFHAERFGRNLNMSILTLFTPEENIEIEQLQKYAIAIKTNTYTDSFQEAILECVDEVLKTKTTVYDTNGFFD